MTKITDLTQKAGSTLAGNEEFLINDPDGNLDRKVTTAQITQKVANDLTAEISAVNSDIATLDSCKMEKSGESMTGILTLSGAPTADLHAATKKYVDDADNLKSDIASPTFTGTPLAPTATDGTSTTQIATTEFVLNQLDEYMFERTAVTSSPKTLTEDEAGIVGVDVAGNVTINLPQISALSSAGRVFYLIKDEGYNASTSQTITINRGGSDTIDNAATSITITDAGEGVYLYNDGGTAWYTADPKTAASTTLVGEVELATDAETLTRTDTARAVTPSNLDHLLKNTLYKTTVLGAASKTFIESEQGLWYVTYTNTGPVTITLPSPAALGDSTNTQYHIVDAGDATTNNITISSAAGNINGAASFTIDTTQTGAIFFNDGTDWYTAADSATASSAAATPWTTNGTEIYYTDNVGIGNVTNPNSLLHLEKSTGDPAITFAIGGTDKFILGLDDSAADNLKISSGNTIGTNDVLEISTTDGGIGINTTPVTDTALIVEGFGISGNSFTVNDSRGAQVFGIDDAGTSTIDTVVTTNQMTANGGANAGIGYSTGAGGTVTQITNRTTAVTLHRPTGTITTDTTSLAAGAAATFTVTNNAMALTDVPVVCISSGETTNQTNVRVTGTAAGSFDITVENNHPSTAETGAIVINFAIIKGVTA